MDCKILGFWLLRSLSKSFSKLRRRRADLFQTSLITTTMLVLFGTCKTILNSFNHASNRIVELSSSAACWNKLATIYLKWCELHQRRWIEICYWCTSLNYCNHHTNTPPHHSILSLFFFLFFSFQKIVYKYMKFWLLRFPCIIATTVV
jgi:hypothetical protein